MSEREEPGGTGAASVPGMQALLQQLAAGGDGGALVQSLIGSTTMTPEASLLAGLLMSEAGRDGADDDSPDDEEDEIERLLAFAERDEFDEGRAAGDDDELEALREVNDTVAAALGACPECWGGDPECRTCAGEGAAGALDPDERLFAELVLPAVRRVRENRRARPVPSSAADQSTA